MIKDLPLDAYIVMAKVIKFCFMNDYVQFFKVFRNAITLTWQYFNISGPNNDAFLWIIVICFALFFKVVKYKESTNT